MLRLHPIHQDVQIALLLSTPWSVCHEYAQAPANALCKSHAIVYRWVMPV